MMQKLFLRPVRFSFFVAFFDQNEHLKRNSFIFGFLVESNKSFFFQVFELFAPNQKLSVFLKVLVKCCPMLVSFMHTDWMFQYLVS